MYPSLGTSQYNYPPPPPPPGGAPSGSSEPPPPSYSDALSSLGMAPPPPPPYGGGLSTPPPPSMEGSFLPPSPPPQSSGSMSSMLPPPPPSSAYYPSLTSTSSLPPPPPPPPPDVVVPGMMGGGTGVGENRIYSGSNEGRRLMFVGIRNFVICRETKEGGESEEVWRHEVGGIVSGHYCNTYVVFCAGLVVARYLKSLTAFDPITGNLCWSLDLPEYGILDICVVAVNDPLVLIGVKNIVLAVSVPRGQIIWRYIFPSEANCLLPSILCCNLSLLVVGGKDIAYLNMADGIEHWRTSSKHCLPTRPPTAVWDGKNRVLLGFSGYLYPVDLRNGTEGEAINLKGTGYNNVVFSYDKYRDVFYVLTLGALYAFTAGDSNTILWKVKVQNAPLCSLAVEFETGRIYVVGASCITCVDINGNLLFQKKFDEPSLSKSPYCVVLDLLGSGRIFIGSGGFYLVVDSEGNKIERDELKGMRYGATILCSTSASADDNACGNMYQRLALAYSA